MKKKSIKQIVIYFYTAAFLILTIIFLTFTIFFSQQSKAEQLQRLKTCALSTHRSIDSTINTMNHMHKILYPNTYHMFQEYNEIHKIEILEKLFMCRDLNNNYFYNMLFFNDNSYEIITSDINPEIVQKIFHIYRDADNTNPHIEFFYATDKKTNSNIIYIYNSYPIIYSNTKDIEKYSLGTSVLITQINITEYNMTFGYSPSMEISLNSDKGEQIHLTKRNSSSPILGEYTNNITGTGWSLQCSTSNDTNTFGNHTLFELFFFQAFLTVLLFIIIFRIIYKIYILKPINQISGFLDEYTILNKTLKIPVQSCYEFDKISKYISRMTDNNHNLIRIIFKNQQTIYEKEIENTSYKLYALKSQINPHFLYNTLECISSLAYVNNVRPIADITNTLSKILRYTITDQPYATVKDEIALTENYFKIIKMRYPGRINYRICFTDDSILEYNVLHMFLQPLAENSVKHNDLFSKKIFIYIKTYTIDDTLYIIIMDNGKGMTTQQLNSFNDIFQKQSSTTEYRLLASKHIGIKNVNSQIKLTYGEEYGITLRGKENRYLKITIKLPVQHETQMKHLDDGELKNDF